MMKTKKTKRLLILLFLFCTAVVSAQTEDVYVPDTLANDSTPRDRDAYQVEIPYYQYKSPEAAAFRKYGEYAVNEYTGNPNISRHIHASQMADVYPAVSIGQRRRHRRALESLVFHSLNTYFLNLGAKLRINERNAKGKLVFLFISMFSYFSCSSARPKQHPSFFSKFFKRLADKTPLEYRLSK